MIIKKLLTFTLSILMIGSITVGCGKKNVSINDTPIATNTVKAAVSTAIPVSNSDTANQVNTQKISNATKPIDTSKTNTVTTKSPESFYGQWKINKEITFGPVSIYSNDAIKGMIGKVINYSVVEAVYGAAVCKNPYYEKSNISKTSFETSNKTRFSALGITTNSIDQFTVFTSSNSNSIWDSTGSVFYIKDQNTLILFDGGVYFQLTKVTN